MERHEAKTQLQRVIYASLHHRYPMTLEQFADKIRVLFGTPDTPAAISARLREVKVNARTRDKFSVRRTQPSPKTFQYQVLSNRQAQIADAVAPSHLVWPNVHKQSAQELAANILEAKLRHGLPWETVKAYVEGIEDEARRGDVIRAIGQVREMINANGTASWLEFRAQQQRKEKAA